MQSSDRVKTWLRSSFAAATVIFCLALVPKVVLIAVKGWIGPSPDETRYLTCAGNLWNEGTFGLVADEAYDGDPVLYPLLLSVFVGTFGSVPVVVLYVQIIISSLSACVAYLLARRICGDVAGWCAGIMCASYVPMMVLPARFLTETLAVLWMLVGMLLVDVFLTERRPRRAYVLAGLVGAVFALQALTRTIAFPLLVIALSVCCWKWRKHPTVMAGVFAACFGLFVIVYTPWVARNYCAFGQVRILTSKGPLARQVAYYSAEFISAGDDLETAREKAFRILAEGKQKGEQEVESSMLSMKYLRHCGQRLLIMLGAHPCLNLPFPFAGQNFYAGNLCRWFNYFWNPVVWIGVVLCGWHAVRERNVRMIHIIVLPLTLLLLYSLVHAIPRYQFVSYASMSVAAGCGLAFLYTRTAKEGQ